MGARAALKKNVCCHVGDNFFREGDFSRLDETNDSIFYARDRFVEHLDSVALSTVQNLIGDLIVEEGPVILDLMASRDSHIPDTVKPTQLVGLGLNRNELLANKELSDRIVHDLNRNPRLPFPDSTFDSILNTVSVDYLTKPIEVFAEGCRVLKPGGLYVVIFSNRFFPEKVVKIWREASEEERIILVQKFFEIAGGFDDPEVFVSKGRPRPRTDNYAHLPIASDPIYAVYAQKKGGSRRQKRIARVPEYGAHLTTGELAERVSQVKTSLRCPHCGERLKKWAVPQTPFTEWETDHMHVCFNDACPYLVRGWDTMQKQGNCGMSYRLMYNPSRDRCMPMPVPSLGAFRESIME